MHVAVMEKKNKFGRKFSKEFIRRWIKAQEERAELDRISRDANCREEGAQQMAKEIAINLLRNGLPFELVMKNVDLPRETLLNLARENNIEIKM